MIYTHVLNRGAVVSRAPRPGCSRGEASEDTPRALRVIAALSAATLGHKSWTAQAIWSNRQSAGERDDPRSPRDQSARPRGLIQSRLVLGCFCHLASGRAGSRLDAVKERDAR